MLRPVFIWQNKKLKKIKPEQVTCLCADENYTRIFLEDKSHYMVRSTLSGTLKKFPHGMFIKVHRAYAASINFIDEVDRDHMVVDGEPMPVSKQYYRSVMRQLNVID